MTARALSRRPGPFYIRRLGLPVRSLRLLAALAAAAALVLACSRGDGAPAKERLRAGPAGAPAAFDWERPARALELTPDEVAARLGSFEWTAAVEWAVSRDGEDARRVHAVERHRVRQAASGEFEVRADLDPGLGPGSETGREIVFVDGTTYARAHHAPFRERPTDRGRDARRFRDESFLSPGAIARLLGPGLELRADRDASALRRPARRFVVSLAKPGVAPAAAPAAAPPPGDDDTRLRRAFLAGLRPTAASGEVLLDAATGAPLRVRLSASFAVQGEPGVRATAELLAQVTAHGGEVAAIAAPKGALPDERKPAGVAGALDAAGLERRGAAAEKKQEGRPERADDEGEE